MKVIVTCGPAYEPIDEVRRLTNFSTGQLGVLLANRLARAGHEVICCKAEGATCAERLDGPRQVSFGTNDDLRAALAHIAEREEIGAVFHAAALCDYRLKRIGGVEAEIGAGKISSRAGELTLTLAPAEKLIGKLRALFPQARIVGWKYELEGSRDDALAKALRQLEENATDACVLNGRAYGSGFGVVQAAGPPHHIDSRAELCDWLAAWLSSCQALPCVP